MSSELHRFQIDEHDPVERQLAGLRKLAIALITNPSLNIGDTSSQIVHPDQNPARGGAATTVAEVAGGAFFTTRTVVSEDATNGDIYLQGGQVSGWATPIAEILLYDASATSWQGTPGQLLEIIVTGAGSATSGILDPIYTPSAVSTPAATSTLGTNTLPTAASLTGKLCHISLGTFIAGGFQPAGSGNLQISFCWGGYTISRF